MKISDIPVDLRPREKALHYGIEELSDQELLTLLIGSGGKGNSAIDIAINLLASHGNSLESLLNTNYASLQSYLGLKKSIALRLLATFEFHKRIISNRYKKVEQIESINDVYFKYKYIEDYDQEIFVILMLNSKHKIIKEKLLYKGTSDSFSIDIREVLHELILARAKYFYLLHNHPDEDPNPSDEDILATKAIEKSAKSLGIKLINHLIVFKGGCSYIKEEK